jgi:hypothetical protein
VCVQQEKENLVAASLTLSQRLATGVSCTWHSPSSALSSNQGNSEAFTKILLMIFATISEKNSVPDPGPFVFGPPGSGSTSQRNGSGSGVGSGSFYRQAKIVRKTLILIVL